MRQPTRFCHFLYECLSEGCRLLLPLSPNRCLAHSRGAERPADGPPRACTRRHRATTPVGMTHLADTSGMGFAARSGRGERGNKEGRGMLIGLRGSRPPTTASPPPAARRAARRRRRRAPPASGPRFGGEGRPPGAEGMSRGVPGGRHPRGLETRPPGPVPPSPPEHRQGSEEARRRLLLAHRAHGHSLAPGRTPVRGLQRAGAVRAR